MKRTSRTGTSTCRTSSPSRITSVERKLSGKERIHVWLTKFRKRRKNQKRKKPKEKLGERMNCDEKILSIITILHLSIIHSVFIILTFLILLIVIALFPDEPLAEYHGDG